MTSRQPVARRPVVSVIGFGGELDEDTHHTAMVIGRLAVEAGFRIVTGGLGGVMSAACEGARCAANYREGATVALIPSDDPSTANPYADVVIPTGLGVSRNALVVAAADVVIAIGGGAGTLSELAMAWQAGKPIIALRHTEGWSKRLADACLDGRRSTAIQGASTPEEAIQIALKVRR